MILDSEDYILLLVSTMGCGSSDGNVNKPGKKETVFGVFEVQLMEANIEHITSRFTTMDPYVVVKFSNQTFKGQVVKNGGQKPQFKDRHTFFVNSYYKHLGRCLEIELMDSNIASDDVIGYGIIDLDPYLNALQMGSPQHEIKPIPLQGDETSPPSKVQPRKQDTKKTTLRCFLNYDRKKAGFIILEASFRQEPTNIISFRFETAEFQRSTRTFGDMNCYVRVTAGEEILETQKSKDTVTDKPVWKDEHLSFTCPLSLEKITIEVMDENNIIGQLVMDKKDLLLDDSENQFAREIIYEGKVAGKLWFNTKKNANPLFKELNRDYKKKLPMAEKKEEKKGEDNKGQENKGEDKKGEDKKGEENKGEEKKGQNNNG